MSWLFDYDAVVTENHIKKTKRYCWASVGFSEPVYRIIYYRDTELAFSLGNRRWETFPRVVGRRRIANWLHHTSQCQLRAGNSNLFAWNMKLDMYCWIKVHQICCIMCYSLFKTISKFETGFFLSCQFLDDVPFVVVQKVLMDNVQEMMKMDSFLWKKYMLQLYRKWRK